MLRRRRTERLQRCSLVLLLECLLLCVWLLWLLLLDLRQSLLSLPPDAPPDGAEVEHLAWRFVAPWPLLPPLLQHRAPRSRAMIAI